MISFIMTKLLGYYLVLSHALGILFIVHYDKILNRSHSIGIFAKIGIGYCVLGMVLGYFSVKFWNE